MPAKIVVKVFGGDPVEAMHPAFEPQVMTFALRDGELMHVDEVANGLGCGCLCPSCGEALIAKQGTKSAHHFAHKGGGDCKGGLQTSLHLAAKHILSKEMCMRLPEFSVTEQAEDLTGELHEASKSFASRMMLFDAVEQEVCLGSVVPDIVAIKGGRKLLVEIAVTHFVDENKAQKLRSMNLACLEVNLAGLIGSWTWESLRDALVDQVEGKTWIHNPWEGALRAEAALNAQRIAKNTLQRKRGAIQGFDSELKKLDALIRSGQLQNEAEILDAESHNDPGWIEASRWLHIIGNEIPDHINVPVQGDFGFLVARRVWQAALCVWIRKYPGNYFKATDAMRWCHLNFPYRDGFAILHRNAHLLDNVQRAYLPWHLNAVRLYLEMLSKKGRIRRYSDRYEILLRR